MSDNLKRVIDYASNPEKTEIKDFDQYDYNGLGNVLSYTTDKIKTEKQCYVSGINVDVVTAFKDMGNTKKLYRKEKGILAFHGYQSFVPNEVTAETAHQIGVGSATNTTLPQEIVDAVKDCGFLESIPLWAVTLLGGIFITVLSFIMILTVYGRFFKLYMYSAIAPVPLSTAAGESTQGIATSFMKSYLGVCMEGAIIILSCIIFSAFASSPPAIDPTSSAVSMVWTYVGKLSLIC